MDVQSWMQELSKTQVISISTWFSSSVYFSLSSITKVVQDSHLSSGLNYRLLTVLSATMPSLYNITYSSQFSQTNILKYKFNDMSQLVKTLETLIPPQGIKALLNLTLANLSSFIFLSLSSLAFYAADTELAFPTRTKAFPTFRLYRSYASCWNTHSCPCSFV